MNESNVFESLKKFTDKQQEWFWEYLKSFNATEAAKAVNYKDPKQSGWENKQVMRSVIDAYLESESLGAKEVLRLLAQHATFKMSDAGKSEYQHLIKKVQRHDGEITSIEASQFDAVALLAKIHGLTSAKKQEGNTGKLNEWLEQIKEAREKYGSE
jgi:phage terminase small subunit